MLLCTLSERPNIIGIDLRSGEVALTMETDKPVTSLALCADQRTLCSAEAGGVRLWDAATLTQEDMLPIQGWECEAASFDPKTQRIAAGGADMWVHVFDRNSKAQLDVCKGHHGPVHTVMFSPSGDTFASGSEDGTIRIWNNGGSVTTEAAPVAETNS